MADLHQPDENGNYPIHLAVKRGSFVRVSELIRDGSPIDPKDGDGHTPIQLAVISYWKFPSGIGRELVNMLISEGSRSIGDPDISGSTLWHKCYMTDFTLNNLWDICQSLGLEGSISTPNKDGDTPLFAALKNRDLDAFIFIAARTSWQDLNSVNKDGDSAMILAAKWSLACVHHLAKLECHTINCIGDKRLPTVFHAALKSNNYCMIEELLLLGASNFDYGDHRGVSVLEELSRSFDGERDEKDKKPIGELIKILLALGAPRYSGTGLLYSVHFPDFPYLPTPEEISGIRFKYLFARSLVGRLLGTPY